MPKGTWKNRPRPASMEKQFACVFGCGKLFARLGSSKKCAGCVKKAAPKGTSGDAYENRILLKVNALLEQQQSGFQKQIATMEKEIRELRQMCTGRAPRGNYKMREAVPRFGFDNWDAEAFLASVLVARETVRGFNILHRGGRLDIFRTRFLDFITHVLFYMNGNTNLVYIDAAAQKDKHDNPLEVELNLRARRRSVTRRYALKLLTNRELIPTWDELRDYLDANRVKWSRDNGQPLMAFVNWDIYRGRMCTRLQLGCNSESQFLRSSLLQKLADYQDSQKLYVAEQSQSDDNTRYKLMWEDWMGFFDYVHLNRGANFENVVDMETMRTHYGGTHFENPILQREMQDFFSKNLDCYEVYLGHGGKFSLGLTDL